MTPTLERCESFSLSQRERAGVRENGNSLRDRRQIAAALPPIQTAHRFQFLSVAVLNLREISLAFYRQSAPAR